MEIKNITIFLPICREWRIDKMVEQIKKLVIDSYNINLLIILDNDLLDTVLVKDLFFTAVGYKIPKITVRNTGNLPASEAHADMRRERITQVWKMAQQLIPYNTDLVFTIEDDTDISPTTLIDLIENYKYLIEYEGYKVGVVSGVQAGRWGFKMIGAWIVDNPSDPKTIATVAFNPSKDVEEVDAAGFYCFITPKDLFVNAQYKWNHVGPDVNYGLDLRAKGYRVFVDWTIVAGHDNKYEVLVPDDKCVIVKFEKQDNDIWVRTAPLSEPIKVIDLQ